MARFNPAPTVAPPPASAATKNYPFNKVYGSAEGDMVYLNMTAVPQLQKGMTTLRDIAVLVDYSGSMRSYYKSGEVKNMLMQIVDSVAPFDDDGLDLIFWHDGIALHEVCKSAADLGNVMTKLEGMNMGTTFPVHAFKKFCDQLKQKNRPGTVFFLTDGAMDDGGTALKNFYKDVLHTQFKTRDQFYCYAIEFGPQANNALSVLDGLYPPEQGPEDLFDLESAEKLDRIAATLSQVGGMSAIGSEVELVAAVDAGAKIDMVNADLIPGGMDTITGPINQVMSLRLRTTAPTTVSLKVAGYDPMQVRVTPKTNDDPTVEIL